MALPLIAGVVRITYRGSLPSGTQWANVLHFRYAGGASSPGASDITALDAVVRRLYVGTAFAGGFAWFANCKSTSNLIDATAYVLNGTSVPQVININTAGSLTANMEPQEVAHVLTLRTAKRGRSYRGRVYLPAACTTILDASGNLQTTYANGIQAQATGIVGALGGPATAPFWEWGVASYLHSTFEPLLTTSCDTRPDVQRRRKR